MKFRLDISGMSCEHCVNFLKGILCDIDGVSDVAVEINSAALCVDDRVTQTMLKEAVEDAGFELIGVYPDLEN